MRTARALLRACHPEPTAAVTVIIAALAVSAGRGLGAVWVGLAVLAGQLSVGWSNDYLDRGRDRLVGRTGKPLVRGAVSARVVSVCAVAALLACVPLSLASGPPAAAAHLTGVAAAWSYNLGVKRTALSFVPYAVAFGLLPAFVTLGLPGRPWPAWWALSAGAAIGVAAHFANVVPDIGDDLATGIRGLPQRLGEVPSRLLAAWLLIAATVLLTVVPPGPVGPLGGVGLAAVAVIIVTGVAVRVGGRGSSRAAFLVTILVAALDVALLLAQGGRLISV